MKDTREVLSEIDQVFAKNIKWDLDGFLHIEYRYDSNTGFFYRDIGLNGKVDVILYSYGSDGGWSDFSNPFLNRNRIKSWIIFEDVTSILFRILEQSNIQFVKSFFSGTDSICLMSFPDLNKDQNFLAAKPNNLILYDGGKVLVENVKEIATEIYNCIIENHSPFFEKASNLQVVNDEIIDKIPHMELHKYIPGQYMNMKKLIIMKLCDNPNYDEFKQWLLETYQKMVEKDAARYSEKLELVKKLVAYLDSGEYNLSIVK
jgi:hypothetical protein